MYRVVELFLALKVVLIQINFLHLHFIQLYFETRLICNPHKWIFAWAPTIVTNQCVVLLTAASQIHAVAGVICLVSKHMSCVKILLPILVKYTLQAVDSSHFEFDTENATCRHITDINLFI